MSIHVLQWPTHGWNHWPHPEASKGVLPGSERRAPSVWRWRRKSTTVWPWPPLGKPRPDSNHKCLSPKIIWSRSTESGQESSGHIGLHSGFLSFIDMNTTQTTAIFSHRSCLYKSSHTAVLALSLCSHTYFLLGTSPVWVKRMSAILKTKNVCAP